MVHSLEKSKHDESHNFELLPCISKSSDNTIGIVIKKIECQSRVEVVPISAGQKENNESFRPSIYWSLKSWYPWPGEKACEQFMSKKKHNRGNSCVDREQVDKKTFLKSNVQLRDSLILRWNLAKKMHAPRRADQLVSRHFVLSMTILSRSTETHFLTPPETSKTVGTMCIP